MRDPATRDTGDLPRRGDVRSSERGTILIITTIILILIITLAVDAKFIAQIEWEATTNADVDFMLEVALRGAEQHDLTPRALGVRLEIARARLLDGKPREAEAILSRLVIEANRHEQGEVARAASLGLMACAATKGGTVVLNRP